MNTNKLFNEFNKIIKLNSSKTQKLKSNRKAIRERIRQYFEEKSWDLPKFYPQGSFPLNTNLNPIKKETDDGDIKEKYDLDDGVYFICPYNDRKNPGTYHDRIKKAVNDHAEEVIDKNTCIRVVYADGHHVDLPSYWIENNGDIPKLAHKSEGYIDSDPKQFKDWVHNKISNANSNGQLRRIIRYFKAWKDYREDENSNIKLPSGFILTILACEHYSKEDDRDDLSLKNTAERIKKELEIDFTCYRPTMPMDEELLHSYSENTVLKELDKLIDNAQDAVDSDVEKDASELWRKVFGDRFPLEKGENDKSSQSNNNQPIRTKVSAPWISS